MVNGGARLRRNLNQENNNNKYHKESLNNNNDNNNNNNNNNDVNIDNYINSYTNSPPEGAPVGKATGQSSYRPKAGQSTKNMGRAITTAYQKQQQPAKQYQRKQLSAKEQKNISKQRKNKNIQIKKKKITKLEKNLKTQKELLNYAKSFVQNDGRLIIKPNERIAVKKQIELYNDTVLQLDNINEKLDKLTNTHYIRLTERLEHSFDYERELEAYNIYLLSTQILHGYKRGYVGRFLQIENKKFIKHFNTLLISVNSMLDKYIVQLRKSDIRSSRGSRGSRSSRGSRGSK